MQLGGQRISEVGGIRIAPSRRSNQRHRGAGMVELSHNRWSMSTGGLMTVEYVCPVYAFRSSKGFEMGSLMNLRLVRSVIDCTSCAMKVEMAAAKMPSSHSPSACSGLGLPVEVRCCSKWAH